MKLSDDGYRLIRSFEGYHKRLPDGRCLAYRCPANKWTIGYGCTEGVKEGMIWTEAEAEENLRKEIAKFEAGVTRLVTTEINQNEFDSLTSFAYNCGLGALKKSALLKKLNKGDKIGAAREFAKWRRGGGRVLPGLVSRRERETALFLKPVVQPEEPYMPQEVAKVTEVSKPVVAVGAATVATVAAPVVPPVTFPSPPDLGPVTDWTTYGDRIGSVGSWVMTNPTLTGLCVLWAAGIWFYPQMRERFTWLQWRS
jgi:lysozyme